MEPRVPLITLREVWIPCCISRKIPNSAPSLDRRPDTYFTTREESRVSCPNMRPGLTPLLKNSIGTPKLLSQLEQNPEFPTSTWDEALFSCSDLKGILRCPLQLERRPHFPEATWEVPWRPRRKSRGTQSIPRHHHKICPSSELRHDSPAVTQEQSRSPVRNLKGDLTSPRQQERFPEVPVATQDVSQASRHNLRKTMRFPAQYKMMNFSTAAPQEQSQFPSRNLKEGLTPFMQLKVFPKIPITTWKEPRVSHHNLRRAPSSPPKRNPESPLTLQEEACLTFWNSRGTRLFLLQVERTPSSPSTWDKVWFPCTDSNGTPSIPSQHEGRSDTPIAPLEKSQVPAWTQQEAWHGFYILRGKRSSMPPHDTRPDSPVESW